MLADDVIGEDAQSKVAQLDPATCCCWKMFDSSQVKKRTTMHWPASWRHSAISL